MNKKLFSKTALLSVLITLSVYAGAMAIYFYANGWRLNFKDGEVVKTGVLTVDADPNLSTIYIDGEEKGRTPSSRSLNVGTYSITVARDGYLDWTKDVNIKEEKSTPIFPWLIKEDIEGETVYSKEEELVRTWSTKYQGNILFLTKIENEKDAEYLYTYNIWNYDVNPAFWDLSNNPFIITSTESNEETLEIDLNIFSGGNYAILEYNSKYYLLENQRTTTFDNLTILSLKDFEGYTKTWSLNHNYLILESDNDIISYDINKDIKHLLVKKSEGIEYIYNTDHLGLFYLLEELETDMDVNRYRVTQRKLDGTGTAELIENMYFQKDTNYITEYRTKRDNGNRFTCEPFTNSPECTQTTGSITSFITDHAAKGVFISTDQATYWYDLREEKFLMISSYPAEFISLSPDHNKVLYRDTTGINIFTFDKEEADHTSIIGSQTVLSNTIEATNHHWISNSRYISYTENNELKVIDQDQDNMTVLLDTTDYEQAVISSTSESIVTLEETTEGFSIKHFSIN